MARTTEDSQNVAARLDARANKILTSSGIMFVIWQITYFMFFAPRAGAPRSVDLVAAIGFITWAAALLMLLATGGGAFRARAVQEILDDELARSQRAQAYQNAFWAMMLVCLAAYLWAQFTIVDARVLAHVTLSAGVLVAVATMVFLKRR